MVRLVRTGSPWRDLPAHYGSWKTVDWRCHFVSGDPGQVGSAPPATFDRVAYPRPQPGRAQRGPAQQFRRVVTRHDKRAVNDLAWVTLAVAIIWL